MIAVILIGCGESSSAAFLVQPLPQGLLVAGRVVLDDLEWVERIYFVDVLAQLVSWVYLYLLDLLEATALDEGLLRHVVDRKGLCELVQHVLQDVVGAVGYQRLQGV